MGESGKTTCGINAIQFQSAMRRYPGMQPADVVKLLYQDEFAGGHMISNPEASLERLRAELRATPSNANIPLCETITGCARVNLGAMRLTQLAPETLNRMFVLSANGTQGDKAHFIATLEALADAIDFSQAGFSRVELNEYLAEYARSGYTAVHHSAAYSELYRPAYRVIRAEYARILALVSAIDGALANSDKRVIVGIDGNCAAGKSTIAALLEGLYGCTVVHMDDFFLPPALRTPERLDEAGGNVHYERFEAEVAAAIRSGAEEFGYRVFDCSRMEYGGWVRVRESRLIVVEGSYSLHPRFGDDMYGVRAFVRCDEVTQLERILARNGTDMLERFRREWIPMEERYFEQFSILSGCDVCL